MVSTRKAVDGMRMVSFFFEKSFGKNFGVTTVTVDSKRYIAIITTFLKPGQRKRQMNLVNVWFQQDDAIIRGTANAYMTVKLSTTFSQDA